VTIQMSERSRERLLDSSDSVLAVIDVQESFLDRIGADAAASLVERIRWLVTVAGHLGIPVVVTEEEPQVNGSTATAIMDALPPGTVVHTKPVFGLADNPDILADVEETSRQTSVLVGMETDVCVAHSALGLLDHGYRVAVVEDATASPGGEHEPGLRRMQEAGVSVMRVKGLFYEWIRVVQGWHDFEQAHPEAKPPTGLVL
jgi:nicotinamidase-related amidase